MNPLSTLMHDIRYTLRQFTRRPGFTAVAVLTLALGIGATTAIFAVLDSVALDPLPYPEADRLVWLDSPVPAIQPGGIFGLAVAEYFYFGKSNRTLESLGAFMASDYSMTTDRGAIYVDGARVTASVFDALRARPALGRLIQPGDDRPGAPAVAVLGYDFWQRQYGADPGVIGSTVRLEGIALEVIGVAAPGTRHPASPASRGCLDTDAVRPGRDPRQLALFARDRPSRAGIQRGRGPP